MAKTNKRRTAEYRTAAAKKAAELRRQQQAAERRRRVLVIGSAVVAIIVIVVVVVVLVQGNRSGEKVASTGKGGVAGTTQKYGFVVGQKSAPATMVVYEDFQCPICKAFEDAYGTMLDKFVDQGKLKVEYRPIAFLNTDKNGQYSTRALNAAACVMDDAGVQAFKRFHDTLYANQPKEGGSGLPDSQLVAYAHQSGAKGAGVKSCIVNEKYKDWTASATESASKDGVNGTPTVMLDGKKFTDLGSKAHFKSAIEKAAKN